jgi:hypothetical protein
MFRQVPHHTADYHADPGARASAFSSDSDLIVTAISTDMPNSSNAEDRGRAALQRSSRHVFSLVAPCQPGASPASVQRRTFTTGCHAVDLTAVRTF